MTLGTAIIMCMIYLERVNSGKFVLSNGEVLIEGLIKPNIFLLPLLSYILANGYVDNIMV